MVARDSVDRRGEQVGERRLKTLVGAPEQPALIRIQAGSIRVDALVDREHLRMHVVLVENRQAPVLGDPLDVVIVRGLVDERPDREAGHGHHAYYQQRSQLQRDKRAERHAQRNRKSWMDSAIQSTMSSVSPGWQPTQSDASVTRSAPSSGPTTRCPRP